MLPTFRLLFVAMGVAVFVLVMAARGLVPPPDVHTRIGEVPSVGRSLVQQAMVPRLSVGPSIVFAQERAQFGETTGSTPVIVETSATAADLRESAAAAARTNLTEPQAESPDPLGDLIKSMLAETPTPAPGAVSAAESPAASAPAQETEAAKAPAAADPPALAFGAESATDRKAASPPAVEKTAAASPKLEPTSPDARAATPPAKAAARPEPSRKAKAKHKIRAAKKEVTRKERVTKRKAAAKPKVHKKASLIHAAHRNRRAATPKKSYDYGQPAVSQGSPGAYQAAPPAYQSYYGSPAGSTNLH